MHFPVLIIGGNAEGQLAPFNENMRWAFNDCTDGYKESFENETMECVVFPDGRKVDKYAKSLDECWVQKNVLAPKEFVCPKGAKLERVKFNEFYPDFDTFAREYHGGEPDANGRWGYWYNPQAKWDWYQMGGRWKDMLPFRDGKFADSAIWREVEPEKLESTGAILFNGRWYEGEDKFMKDDEWETEFRKIISAIPADVQVAIYDLHI
ncbi:MAG: hypothetical protein LBL75_02890 [Rickettsiales bacterium]|jgi:hypothetical protein|nr:hypothetical protein [Rickettsiales bacterium]